MPKRVFPIGERTELPGHFTESVVLEAVRALGEGSECRVWLGDSSLEEVVLSHDETVALAGRAVAAVTFRAINAHHVPLLVRHKPTASGRATLRGSAGPARTTTPVRSGRRDSAVAVVCSHPHCESNHARPVANVATAASDLWKRPQRGIPYVNLPALRGRQKPRILAAVAYHAMLTRDIDTLSGTMCHPDFDVNPTFQDIR